MKIVQFNDGSYGIRQRFWFTYRFLDITEFLDTGTIGWLLMYWHKNTQTKQVCYKCKYKDFDLVIQSYNTIKNPKKYDIGRVV